jgi:hypothetical protein
MKSIEERLEAAGFRASMLIDGHWIIPHDKAVEVLNAAALHKVCPTCNDSGLVGGPTYYQPDHGGDPCPDCSPSQVPAPIVGFYVILTDGEFVFRKNRDDFALNGWPSDKIKTIYDTESKK